MPKARITTKGQVTIPKGIRQQLGLRVGDEIDFVAEDGVVRVTKVIRDNPFDKWDGYLKDLAGQDPDELVDEMRGR